MTILEHLEELRKRLIVASLWTLIGMAIAAVFLAQPVIDLLGRVAGVNLVAIRPTEKFSVYMKVALVTGAALAMPAIVYEAIRFVLPALHPQERKYIFFAVPSITIAFLLGLTFGFLIVVPAAVNFLAAFGGTSVAAMWSLEEYVEFVSTFLFWVGVTFETPIVMFFLARLGIVSADQMSRLRKFAIVGAFLAAAIITPTPDPFNQTIVAIPIYLLYELGVLLARLAGPGTRPKVG